MENTNARKLEPAEIPEDVEFVAVDVSFISATLVLPNTIRAAFKGRSGDAVVLIKPQFEVGRENVGKRGIVRDEVAQESAVRKVVGAITDLSAKTVDVIDSPILGAEGNREFLLYATF
jgi:23S rRNA (cytidine1920-2'-O)/16S rRNA (cytidine1409-2'-O)-methyltransferase